MVSATITEREREFDSGERQGERCRQESDHAELIGKGLGRSFLCHLYV